MSICRRLVLPCLVMALSGLPARAQAPLPARIDSFSPSGEVSSVRQVAVRFSVPMVAMGDPGAASPFDVRCKAAGQGRWVDARHWVYDFAADLPGGLRCSFTPRTGLTGMDGAAVGGGPFVFTTGGPMVKASWPEEGDEQIDEQQIFLLALDTPADPASVRQLAYCSVAGIGERVPVEVLDAQARARVVAQQRARLSSLLRVLRPTGAAPPATLDDARLLMARCARRLPAGAAVQLVWAAGIATADGVAGHDTRKLAFRVRSDFDVQLSCTRQNEQAGCVPILPLELRFGAPVERRLAARIELRSAGGRRLAAQPIGDEPIVEGVRFAAPLPANSEITLHLPGGFVDDAGRAPINAGRFPLRVAIADDPPLIKFSSSFGILEAHAQPTLPVTVRNVEAVLQGRSAGRPIPAQAGQMARVEIRDERAIARWLRLLMAGPDLDAAQRDQRNGMGPRPGEVPLLFGREDGQGAQPFELPRTQTDKHSEVIGIPLPGPGLYVVEFASDRLGAALHGQRQPYYVAAGALVTNLGVHFKRGEESSLVWVTRLDDARPVGGAQVRIADCRGQPLWEGTTDARGLARLDQPLPKDYDYTHCPHAPDALLVVARKDADTGFMLSSWNEGLQPWNFNLAGGYRADPLIAHTVTDRPLFRAGETVSMKHFVRRPTSHGMRLPAPDSLPSRAVMQHAGSGERYELALDWSQGAGVSQWRIPKEAKLGVYDILLTRVPDGPTLQSGQIRVEQYRVPLMRALLKPPAQPVIRRSSLDIDVQLSYLAGGPASGAPVKLRSRIEPYPLHFADYEDFQFGGRTPREGIEAVAPYAFDGDAEHTDGGPAPEGTGPVRTRSLQLDNDGGARVRFDAPPHIDSAHALHVEMEYADPNGQILTAATRALLLPSSLVLGLRVEGFQATRERLSFKVLALSPSGQPQAQRRIVVDAYRRIGHAYRKRLLGGFYSYEQSTEIRRAGEVCHGHTDALGLLVCDGAAPASGELILVARGEDTAGNAAIASTSAYVAGEDDWFMASSSDRIDVLADKRSYEPGDTARFEVRMPFRQATALVSVEREGVLSSKVVQISAKSPFVEVPILDSYGPNAYVSVLALRGRIDPESPGPFAWLKRMIYRIGMFVGLVKQMPRAIDTHPSALVDLTKPAFKLGIAPIRVGWQGYALKVKVDPERDLYRVRERAGVRVHVTDAQGRPAAHAQVAIAAVDEGLLALAPATSWNLLEAMMQRRMLDVSTSTGQAQVIGKRHFGKKAIAPGGGGGAENARELFDTLLLWAPAVQLDAQGSARIEVPLNDSLTQFRVAAIAHAGESRFGTGSATLRTTQDLMLLSGLPAFVRAGDQYTAQVTVRNGSPRPLELEVRAAYRGRETVQLPAQRLTLPTGAARTLGFDTHVPTDGEPQLDWTLSAIELNATGSPAHDELKLHQSVGSAVPVRLQQQTLTQLDAGRVLRLPVALPPGATPGLGGVEVALSASLGGDLAGVRRWMRDYPYTCAEQRASRSVALDDRAQWDALMSSLPAYLDEDGLVRDFPVPWLQGDDSLTRYLISLAAERGWPIPEATRKRMTGALGDFVAGRVTRFGTLPTADLALRKLAALEALSRHGLVQPDMLQTLDVAPEQWPTSGLLDLYALLGRMPGLASRDRLLTQTRTLLRTRMTFSGTRLSFSTERQDNLWWLMVSPDLNAVRALLLLADDPAFQEDMPRLARGVLARQTQGHWSTTPANAWGVLALERFRRRFDHDAVSGRTQARLAQHSATLDWNGATPSRAVEPTARLPWPAQAATLQVEHQGRGRPWAFVRTLAARPPEHPRWAGYRIGRSLSPVIQQVPGRWSRGDVYRVTLDIDAQADMTWVVMDDPVPAGASILGSGLGGDAVSPAAHADGPSFEERSQDAFRAYYRFLPKGKTRLQYAVRLNSAGRFALPPSRIEAMYAPETFGELPVSPLEVGMP